MSDRRIQFISHLPPEHSRASECTHDDLEKRAHDLVERLNYLVDGDQAAGQLIACGSAAVPALRCLLLLGKPGVVYEPRRRAVEVLGALGAKDVLIEYLALRKDIADPAVRAAEEAVENAAARALARWRTPDVLYVLLRSALSRSRAGVIEALGEFRCVEAIPYFVRALEDDICRNVAGEALRALGSSAEIALVAAATERAPSAEEESPSSLLRRAKALDLLADMKPSAESWLRLRQLLDESDTGIVTGAAEIAALVGSRQDRIAAVDRLLTVLPTADWFLRIEIQDCLLALYREGRPRIEKEIAERSALPRDRQVADPLLRSLLSVRRRARQDPLEEPVE